MRWEQRKKRNRRNGREQDHSVGSPCRKFMGKSVVGAAGDGYLPNQRTMIDFGQRAIHSRYHSFSISVTSPSSTMRVTRMKSNLGSFCLEYHSLHFPAEKSKSGSSDACHDPLAPPAKSLTQSGVPIVSKTSCTFIPIFTSCKLDRPDSKSPPEYLVFSSASLRVLRSQEVTNPATIAVNILVA